MRKKIVICLCLIIVLLFMGCPTPTELTFSITYNSNGAKGSVPESSANTTGTKVKVEESVLTKESNLTKEICMFDSWNTQADGNGISYSLGDTIEIGFSDIVLYAIFTNRGPSGGYIFYDDQADGEDDLPDFRYLEAAPEDISAKKSWGIYESPYTKVPGVFGSEIGTGKQNTSNIITQYNSVDDDYAGNACANYSIDINGVKYDDWFLASADELDTMYTALKVNGLGGFQDAYYWSSSQSSAGKAKREDFGNDGYTLSSSRTGTYYVRPIRAFN